eukprot:TRINITY_DN14100_c2_g1_i1.p2 TRINITY_DN14100_c2_g1~~TRINITY_DN14100_c2_g1_i1.p2  ORF type:complete len:262 (+),score=57.66 TRINITY_DN14100_c2_g1_i1:92-877(+)
MAAGAPPAAQAAGTVGMQPVQYATVPGQQANAPCTAGTTYVVQQTTWVEQPLHMRICRGRCEGVCAVLASLIAPGLIVAALPALGDTRGWVALALTILFLFGPGAYLCLCAESTPRVRGWAQGMAIAHGAFCLFILCWLIPMTIQQRRDDAKCDECKRDQECRHDNHDSSPCGLGYGLGRAFVIIFWISFSAFLLACIVETLAECKHKYRIRTFGIVGQQPSISYSPEQAAAAAQQVQCGAAHGQPAVPAKEVLMPGGAQV